LPIVVFRDCRGKPLADTQVVDALQGLTAVAADHRSTIAAHQRLSNFLPALYTIELCLGGFRNFFVW